MVGSLFWQRLVLAASCVLLVTILLPFMSIGSAHAQAPTLVKDAAKEVTVTIKNGCPAVPISTSVKAGDIVSGTATLTSGDPNEPLLVSDTLGVLRPTVAIDLGTTQSFGFIAGKGDQLAACIVGANGDDTGKITFSVVHPNKEAKEAARRAVGGLKAVRLAYEGFIAVVCAPFGLVGGFACSKLFQPTLDAIDRAIRILEAIANDP